jgi:hypothetical protein
MHAVGAKARTVRVRMKVQADQPRSTNSLR